MRRAILSDIHANRAALLAVLADMRFQGIDEIICLGDIVSFGREPRECVDLAIHYFSRCLLGNHDAALLRGKDGVLPEVANEIEWTSEQLGRDAEPEKVTQRWSFLRNCPSRYREGTTQYVHGSPRRPLDEYVFPEDVYNRHKMAQIFAIVDGICFLGHTHVPGVFTEGLEFFAPNRQQETFAVTNKKMLINVGSVGQPRDGDLRPCYVISDDTTIQFRRV